MIFIKQMDKSCLEMYDTISMKVDVRTEYKVKRVDNGLGGLMFEEVQVTPYIKDLSVYESAVDYEKNFDIKNWRFYIAFDDDKPIGAMTIAGRTPNLDMLSGRDDVCILWDIRVEDEYKHQGIGQRLIDIGINDVKSDGYRQMIIECQNNNVPACHFYRKQGALLSKVDMYAYCHVDDCKDEIQFLWYLDLDK